MRDVDYRNSGEIPEGRGEIPEESAGCLIAKRHCRLTGHCSLTVSRACTDVASFIHDAVHLAGLRKPDARYSLRCAPRRTRMMKLCSSDARSEGRFGHSSLKTTGGVPFRSPQASRRFW
jgi:hypothetical protein